ncbi:MAG TPA: hypothetical protein VF657_14440 [Actinoplanes sp.]
MADLAGPAEATRVGELGFYPHWSLTEPTDIPIQSLTTGDLPVALNAFIPWGRPVIGIALHDGVGEIDVASSFEVFDVSYAARPIPLSTSGTVTTRHGMVLHTGTVRDDPTPTRLAVPGPDGTANLDPRLTAWAERHHVPVDAIHGRGGSTGFNGALQYVATHAGRATAISAAKMIDYPTDQLQLEGAGDSRTPLLLGLGMALAGAAASLPTLIRKARRRVRLASREKPTGPAPTEMLVPPVTGLPAHSVSGRSDQRSLEEASDVTRTRPTASS